MKNLLKLKRTIKSVTSLVKALMIASILFLEALMIASILFLGFKFIQKSSTETSMLLRFNDNDLNL